MATAFPVSTYPLIQDPPESINYDGAERERMSDNSPHIWVLTDQQWREIPLKFQPFEKLEASNLVQYLFDNAATEFDIPQGSDTFTGYFWESPRVVPKDGRWWVTTVFYGRKA